MGLSWRDLLLAFPSAYKRSTRKCLTCIHICLRIVVCTYITHVYICECVSRPKVNTPFDKLRERNDRKPRGKDGLLDGIQMEFAFTLCALCNEEKVSSYVRYENNNTGEEKMDTLSDYYVSLLQCDK